MHIGLYIKWNKGSLSSQRNVLGDELHGESMCRSLRKIQSVKSAELYAPNHMPTNKLDIMIYLNDTEPNADLSRKHVLYMQNAYGEGSATMLTRFQNIGYDGYAFISKRLLDLHVQAGFYGIFLPFGVDLETFYPRRIEKRFAFDVAYIGNDIKGEDRTNKYLLPAAKYNFGLFGNWNIPKHKYKFWKNWQRKPEYQAIFQRLSQGKIPQQKVPVLYSSAKINLNCTAQDCVDWDVITLRTYEVLACKGFLITDRVKAAEETMNDYMVFTEGGQDLVDKIDYYLAHDTTRRRMAEAGYEYVTRHASIDSRMCELFTYLEGIA
jgi:spore maturation protein CgeB